MSEVEGLKAKFIPTLCKEDSEFSGHIILRLPSFTERMNIIEESSLSLDDSGEVSGDKNKMIKSITKIIELIKDNYLVVDVTHKPTGHKIDSYIKLASFPGCENILTEVAQKFMGGFKLGNDLKLI